jgi:hypothetical protein
MWAWNKLRTGKQVVVSGSGAKPTVFALKGAAGVIPAFGDNGCVAKFDIRNVGNTCGTRLPNDTSTAIITLMCVNPRSKRPAH